MKRQLAELENKVQALEVISGNQLILIISDVIIMSEMQHFTRKFCVCGGRGKVMGERVR